VLTPARRIAAAVSALLALAAGGYFVFWTIGVFAFFALEWFQVTHYMTGGIGAVSVGISEALIELLLGLPLAILANRLLRQWARSARDLRRTLHHLHTWALWLLPVLFAIGGLTLRAPGTGDTAIFSAIAIASLFSVVYGLQFLLLGALLGMYAATPDAAVQR
jgi:hypothetical protein